MSAGFDSACGIRGGKLSGGQKQRVAIARTIIREPTILILDEATSALDETSQKKVQGALANAMKGRTTIIIAHRMSTIEGCDKIFVLENGVVKEEGGFKELQNQGGLFAKLSFDICQPRRPGSRWRQRRDSPLHAAAPGTPQSAPKTPQDAPKTLQETPKTCSRRSKKLLRSFQDAPEISIGRPQEGVGGTGVSH